VPPASGGGAWSDLVRPPLSQPRLQRALGAGGSWREVRVLDSTSSTNADVLAAAAGGAAEGLVVVAEQQVAGRGRLSRAWESPARAGLLVSVLLRPSLPPTALPLLPLLAGLALADAVEAVADVPVGLKWPNDLLVDGRKLGGILVERAPDGAVVVGFGINVSTRREELPVDTATSLALEGGSTDREPLLKECLRSLKRRYAHFDGSGGAPTAVLSPYRTRCETIGRRVTVHAPDGTTSTGLATGVDDNGTLVVREDDGRERRWSAGDVVHVRGE
jgi:BirA family transcriptional regulator, biotin operon repressor / biotin---[acetyl-CoA-carboxylase] ligase